MEKITLVKDTITNNDIDSLIDWLKTYPKLTKGDLTVEFEKKWSEYLGVKYSVFVNSGSSANLAMVYSLMLLNKLKNNKIVVPAVSWVTTVTPAIHLGLQPILCDCDKNNLGLDINHLKLLIKEHNPGCIVLVHVLGVPNNLDEITELCNKHDIILLEDTCESLGSTYNNKKLGTVGLLSSFSLYFGHHISTIEGGMVCTNNEELYHLLLSIRSHGWDRDLPKVKQTSLRKKYNVTDFKALYTFYSPGFNLRSTDLQAFIGIQQLKLINSISQIRNNNFNLYNTLVSDKVWKIKPPLNSFVSSMAYPIITNNITKLVNTLQDSGVECRPLVCGSINEQPFWYERYKKEYLPNASKVHYNGVYVPNHHGLTLNEIEYIADIINQCCVNED